MNIKEINWEYYWDEIKHRKFFIFGFLLLISITSLDNWIIIGPIVNNGQEHDIFPMQSNLHIIMLKAVILVIFAVSWDFLAGYSGQVSFGHALFLGMGAYLSALIKMGTSIGSTLIFPGLDDNMVEIMGIYLDLSVFEAIFFASLIVSVFALVLGIFTLRMEGPYFALVTLVLPLIAIILVTKIWDDVTGGDGGLSILTNAALIHDPQNTNLEGLSLVTLKIEHLYRISLVVALISIAIMYWLARSRYGLVLKSIREDELAASSSGINVHAYKLSAIGISSFFASVAGGLYVQSLGAATSSIFEPERSFEIIIYTILGGIGTIAGSVIGTFILVFAISYYVDRGFMDLPTIPVLIFGLILIVILRYQPRGLVNADSRLRNGLFFGTFFSILMAFYDTGIFLSGLSKYINPADWIQYLFEKIQQIFGESELGFFGVNVYATQGRMIIYFVVGVIMGYYGPRILQKMRLYTWGVWPSLGKFEPPK